MNNISSKAKHIHIPEEIKLLILGALLGMFFITILLYVCTFVTESALVKYNKTKVDLPEEYQLITPNDKLQGNYDKTTNTLHIWFSNPQNN